MKRIQKGFTLIELMIVVAIIGILAAVAIPAYQDYVVKAKLSKVQSTIDPIKMALSLYWQENGSFPAGAETVTTATVNTDSDAAGLFNSIGLAKKPVLPAEVTSMTVTGTATTAEIAMTLNNIKATSIDTKVLTLEASTGSTAVSWKCKTGSTVTEKIALKYFGCS